MSAFEMVDRVLWRLWFLMIAASFGARLVDESSVIGRRFGWAAVAVAVVGLTLSLVRPVRARKVTP